jgi:hypothetical protein
VTRALLGAAFTPWAYRDLVAAKRAAVTYG